MKRAYSHITNESPLIPVLPENRKKLSARGIANYSRMKQILLIALFACFSVSCDRDLEFDVTSVTTPSLTVVAETRTGSGTTTTYTKINGAAIKLYNTQADFNANAAPFKLKTTGADGKAPFTKEDLVQKGVFYVRATSGTLAGTGTTPYVLLNDGETVLHIVLQ